MHADLCGDCADSPEPLWNGFSLGDSGQTPAQSASRHDRLTCRLWLPLMLQHSAQQVVCDGQLLQVPHDIEGILLLNISSYMGGANLWASGRPLPATNLHADHAQSHADGLLEVPQH